MALPKTEPKSKIRTLSDNQRALDAIAATNAALLKAAAKKSATAAAYLQGKTDALEAASIAIGQPKE
jgi:hypothetical protein